MTGKRRRKMAILQDFMFKKFVELVAKEIVKIDSVKTLNQTFKKAEILVDNCKLNLLAAKIADIISGLDEHDKSQIIKEARKLRTKWRKNKIRY